MLDQERILDPVDSTLLVQPVISSFGRFLKYFVALNEDRGGMSSTTSCNSDRNAFDVLMNSARLIHFQDQEHQPSSDFWLEPISERNRKDKLYNSIVHYLTSKGLKFNHASELKTSGVNLVRLLCRTFWHIDGHHHVFRSRSLPIPSTFECFVNFNVPELSKHRKRRTSNLSAEVLQESALDLTAIMNESFWERPGWCELKQELLSLIQSLSGYIDYLAMKNKTMKLHHKSTTPVREIASNIHVKFLPMAVSNNAFEQIEQTLMNMDCYKYINLSSFLPNDPVRKFRALEDLVQHGLPFPCVILTYSSGNNIGNLHFLWKVPSHVDPILSLEASQNTIEEVKGLIPIYHTRAMRTEMFKKFGRVSPSVKPAVLRYFYKSLTG